MRSLNAHLLRIVAIAGCLVIGAESLLSAQQQPSLDWLKHAFVDAGLRAKVRGSMLEVQDQDKNVTVYVDVHPVTQQIHYFALLDFNPLATPSEREAALRKLNSASPLHWEVTSEGLLQASGHMVYTYGLSSYLLARGFAELLAGMIVGLSQLDSDVVMIG